MFGHPKITFTTEPELFGFIPNPVPAGSHIPTWFKRLKNFAHEDPETQDGWPMRTIKRCPPFLDALRTGWLLTTPAEIEVKVSQDGSGVSWQTDFNRDVLQEHQITQIKGHPALPRLPLKFLNYWHLRTPKGWSTLFVPPLNRENEFHEPISGIVETDKYFEYINFPSFLKPVGTTFIIPSGYPIVQCIPFKRSKAKAEVRAMNEKELEELDFTRRKRDCQPSLYRETMWEKKK